MVVLEHDRDVRVHVVEPALRGREAVEERLPVWLLLQALLARAADRTMPTSPQQMRQKRRDAAGRAGGQSWTKLGFFAGLLRTGRRDVRSAGIVSLRRLVSLRWLAMTRDLLARASLT